MASRVMRSRRLLPQQIEQQLRARWTNGLTKTFVDLMVNQVQRGNRLNNSFSKKAWKIMCDDFYQKTSLKWDKEQLKNRYSVLRRQFAIVNSLLELSEFSLDESTGIITANDEAWAKYIKEHPDAEPIKISGCPIYKELCVIFSEPLTNGKHDQSSEQEGEIPSSFPCKDSLNTIQEEEEESSESEEVDDTADDPDTFQPASNSAAANRKRGRKGIDDAIAAAILQMAAASKLRTAAVRQINSRYSIADCIKHLDEMQGVEEVYFSALDLFKNPTAREIFLSLKSDKRLIWLLGKCTASPVT